jgi:hypothetical protein
MVPKLWGPLRFGGIELWWAPYLWGPQALGTLALGTPSFGALSLSGSEAFGAPRLCLVSLVGNLALFSGFLFFFAIVDISWGPFEPSRVPYEPPWGPPGFIGLCRALLMDSFIKLPNTDYHQNIPLTQMMPDFQAKPIFNAHLERK